MISKLTAAIVVCVAVAQTVTAQDNQYRGYGKQRDYDDSYDNGYDQGGRYNSDSVDSYGRYGSHGYKFPPVQSIVDPQYYTSILNDFEACVSHKCQWISGESYGQNISQSLQVVGRYTSCVTECSAFQAVRAVRDFKNLVAALFDMSAFKLTAVRKYLSDSEHFDVIGNRTRIYDSCCLPKDRFVAWDRLFIPVQMSIVGDDETEKSLTRMISVADYLRVCASSEPVTDGWLKNYKVYCDNSWVVYLEALQRNIGTLVLAPSCDRDFLDGNCCSSADKNPRAARFPKDVCVAYECIENGKPGKVNIPLIRELTGSDCEDDNISNGRSKKVIIKYRRVPRDVLKYYTVTTGLPSTVTAGDYYSAIHDMDKTKLSHCQYNQGLAVVSPGGGFFSEVPAPSAAVVDATLKCPNAGRFEYCNVQQYAGHLEKQLFDVSKCNINDFAHSDYKDAAGAQFTLACQYRVLSLKCDCMEAVLNCYNSEYQFTTSLGKILGKAASIMCGFILCQKPKVFSLFGEMESIDKAQIMRQILLQAGAMVPDNSSVPPATIAFLTFGLGMVAFVVVKAVVKNFRRKTIDNEDGYRNLI